jgi:hypothetical protein
MTKQIRYKLLRILPAAVKAAWQYDGGVTTFYRNIRVLAESVLKYPCYYGNRVIEPPGREWGHAPSRTLIPKIKPHRVVE